MIFKEHERTGIKENKNFRENKEQILKKQQREENLQITKDRTIYKQDVAKKYDIGLMSTEKEYDKTSYLLRSYREFYLTKGIAGDNNFEQLIQGYCDYFAAVGENMSALGLRSFRNTFTRTLQIASNFPQLSAEETKEEYVQKQDTAIIDFCIENFNMLEQNGFDMGMTTKLVNFLIDEGTPIQNVSNLKEVKAKVKSLCAPNQSK